MNLFARACYSLAIISVPLYIGLWGCGSSATLADISPSFAWISGDATGVLQVGRGTKGVPDPDNRPGARNFPVGLMTSGGTFWVFGGNAVANGALSTSIGPSNDLWKFDGTNWTWVSGAGTPSQPGTYGVKGVSDPSNIPGGRRQHVGWLDGSGNIWTFGGQGIAAATNGVLNDLWKFDGTNWTWISGDDYADRLGKYGTLGVANALNAPGSRKGASAWSTGNNLWMFGGNGRDSQDLTDVLNDVWKFDGTNWTWMKGSDRGGDRGTYGTKGTTNPANNPRSRFGAAVATDSSGNAWLFGGFAYGTDGVGGVMNDLWKFDGTNWTWVSGSDTMDPEAVRRTQGTFNSENTPSGRVGASAWFDTKGRLWIFGGTRITRAEHIDTKREHSINDVWVYDGANWAWIAGSDREEQFATLGPLGESSTQYMLGARHSGVAVSNTGGLVYLFGGFAYIRENSSSSFVNDVWKVTF